MTATPTTAFGATPAARAGAGTGLRWRDDLVTVVLGLWLMVGLFVDGWAHNNLRQLETFFTLWHALFYTGYGAGAAWLCWLIRREQRAGRVGRAAIPRGYELGLAGTILFGLGGLGDMLWHLAFGVEQNREAFLSPTHLLLFVGMTLIVTSPFRSAWSSPDPAGDAPSFRAFLPALLSLTAATAFVIFMNGYLSAFIAVHHTPARVALYGRSVDSGRRLLSLSQDLNLAMILISNVLLLAPVLLMLRRWRPPFGAVTLLWGLVTALGSAVVRFGFAEYIAVAILAGLAADALIRALRPWPSRPDATRFFALLVPLILWGLYFAATALRWGEAWPPELWAGVTVMAGLSGVGLSLLMLPPPVPART